MKKHYYVKNVRPHFPIGQTFLMYLILERFNAPEWLWGVMGFIYLCYWILQIVLMIFSEGVDIFTEEGNKKVKPSFQKRLEEMAKQRNTKN